MLFAVLLPVPRAPSRGARPARPGAASTPARRWALAGLLAAALTLGGCAWGPSPAQARADAQPPAPPAQWAALGAGTPLPATPAPADGLAQAAWWRLLGDATLDGLMDQALARSTDLAAARAVLRQARASRDLVAAGGQPRLTASGGAARAPPLQGAGATIRCPAASMRSRSRATWAGPTSQQPPTMRAPASIQSIANPA